MQLKKREEKKNIYSSSHEFKWAEGQIGAHTMLSESVDKWIFFCFKSIAIKQKKMVFVLGNELQWSMSFEN